MRKRPSVQGPVREKRRKRLRRNKEESFSNKAEKGTVSMQMKQVKVKLLTLPFQNYLKVRIPYRDNNYM